MPSLDAFLDQHLARGRIYFYLAWKARAYGVNTRFIVLAGEVNRAMPEWVVGKIAQARNDRGKATKGSKILVLGPTYTKNVGDVRESPAAHANLLIDTRGRYQKAASNVIRA
jgi:UDP-N-acetyl-D-glucosamine dehydrogenase